MLDVRVRFPSKEWFESLRDLMNSDAERYRHLGYVDARVALLIAADEGLEAPAVYGITFEAFRCMDVRELSDPREIDPEFVMEAPYGVWKEMIENIRANGRADLTHTLNYLSLPNIPMRVWSDDPLGRDKFFRYNQSLQEFFDDASRFSTEFVA